MTLTNLSLKSLQLLFYLFPITFIFGNLITNIFILLISIIGIFFYQNKLLEKNDKYLLILFLLFFSFILLSSYVNHFFFKENPDILKSIFYLRYLIFLIVLRTMIFKEDINLNYFLIFNLYIVLVVALDIFIQFITGKNILGYEAPFVSMYHTGFFKEELIAGGFILMFSTLGFFSVPLLFKNQSKEFLLIIFIFLSLILLTTLFLAGNRMPTVLFLFFLISSLVLYKNKRKKLFKVFSATVTCCVIFFAVVKIENIEKRYLSFFAGLPNPMLIYKELKKDYPELKEYKNSGKQFYTIRENVVQKNLSEDSSGKYDRIPFYTGHTIIFITSLDLFLDKPLIGGGIKSYRNNCSEKIHLPNRICQSHPHNFFLDLLNDVGIFGLLLIIAPIILLFISNYSEYLSKDEEKKFSDWIYLTVCLAILIQFFPFKSSGSFFSTFNSAFTFLILGISLGIHDLKKQRNNSKDKIN